MQLKHSFVSAGRRGITPHHFRLTALMQLLRSLPLPRSSSGIGLAPILAAVFAFNLGSAAWSAVVAGRLTQDGAGTSVLGVLYAVCELSRLPAALLLPALTLQHGARRVTQVGLCVLVAVPLIGLSGLGNGQLMLIFVLSALPAMAVYVGMPALVLGASTEGRDGWSLAWLGLAGGAGGALGPWTGGLFADSFGLLPVLLLFAAGSALMLPIASLGPLPPRTAWAGWSALAGRGLPWQALAALGLASIADRQSARRVIGVGVAVLVVGSFASALAVGWSPAFVVATSVLGMGASGTRLGAELALIRWLGRDRTAVAAALGETTVLGGRALGAPAAGSFGDAYGGAYAFGAIGLVALLASGVVMALAAITLRRGVLTTEPAPLRLSE